MTDATNQDAIVAPVKAKRAKAKKSVKKAVKKTAGRKASFSGDAKITLVAKENPCRANTAAHAMFAPLKTGMTVDAYLAIAGKKEWDGRGNLRYWVKSGAIKIK